VRLCYAGDGSFDGWRKDSDGDNLQLLWHPVAEYIDVPRGAGADSLERERSPAADDPINWRCILQQERIIELLEQGVQVVDCEAQGFILSNGMALI